MRDNNIGTLQQSRPNAGTLFTSEADTKLRRMKQSTLFLIAVFIILLSSAFLYNTQGQFQEQSAQYERGQRLERDLLVLMSTLKDIETGARGYALTGDEDYLEPYVVGKDDVVQQLDDLDKLVAGDPVQRPNIEHISQLIMTHINLAGELISLTSETGPISSPDAFTSLEAGKSAMDQVRRAVDQAVVHERRNNQARNEALLQQVWLRNVSAALAIFAGIPLMFLLFIVRNREITKRIETELELKKLTGDLENRVALGTAELQQSMGFLDLVLKHVPDTVFLIDTENHHRNVIWSHVASHGVELDSGEFHGNSVYASLSPEVIASLRADDEKIMASRQTATTIIEDIPTPNGARTVEFRRVPVQDHEGNWRYLLSIARDVTDQRILERQNRHVQRLEAIGQLTGGIAHDFNNLLAVILGNCDLLRERLASDSELTELADEVIGAAEHGAELTRRLLAFARKQHLQPTALDLNDRLPEIVRLLKRTLGADISIEVSPGNALWLALVDPGQVDDALLNLAINARDAMPDGGHLVIETANVALSGDYAAEHIEVKPGDYVLLSVSDTGSGMPPNVVARAFEPFYTTKDVGRGTGLGLSQIYGWVKQSGGHIKIYSEVGHGTTVKLYLPRANAPAESVSESAPSSETAPTGSETVLVVEDNPKLRRVVIHQLQVLGYSTLEAEDAQTALQIIQSGGDCELLFADVVMPGGMTGYELAKIVSATHPQMKILLTSGYTELAARIGNGDFHKYTVLSKPYRKIDLAQALRTSFDS